MKKNYFLLLAGLLLFNYTATAQLGNGLNFDNVTTPGAETPAGTGDEVNVTNNASLQITGTAITLEAMVNIDEFSNTDWRGAIINKLGGSATGYAISTGDGGKVRFILGQGGAWTEFNTGTTPVLTAGQWHHVAATYDGTTMRIYVDAVEVGTNPASISIANNTDNLRIGESNFTGRFIDGTIDEVRIWNVVRTPVQIDANKASELAASDNTGLVAYYKFNQGTANGDNSAITELTDETGANNGSFVNMDLNGNFGNFIGGSTLSTESFSLDSISVFPNPVKNTLNVKGLTKSTKYSIYNVLGQQVSKGDVLTNSINVESLKSGIYLLNFEDLGAIKIIKE